MGRAGLTQQVRSMANREQAHGDQRGDKRYCDGAQENTEHKQDVPFHCLIPHGAICLQVTRF